MTGRARVGIIGAGDISGRYIAALKARSLLRPIAIASERDASARARAQEHGLRASTVAEMLAAPDVDLVLNLAPPRHHHALTARALAAGKHVYSEKPLAGSLAEAETLADAARRSGLLLACAPAIFLGPALQTARRLVDDGKLGPIVGARLSMIYPGPDLWHHNPDHLFDALGGPLFDMGVYHLSAMVALLGPVTRVQALASTAHHQRAIRAGPRAGEPFPVRTPTHVSALLATVGGAHVTATFSFDGFGSQTSGLEVFGTQGSLAVAQPSQFDSAITLSRSFPHWEPCMPALGGWSDGDWSIGPLEAWAAHRAGREPRTSTAFACHVLEVLVGILKAARKGEAVTMLTKTDRPAPLVTDYDKATWAVAHEEGSGDGQQRNA